LRTHEGRGFHSPYSPVRGARRAQVNINDIVDLELLTHTEVSQKLKDGWTSILLVTGEWERGPQDVLGGHTMMAHSHAVMVAKKWENARGAGTAGGRERHRTECEP
jgi:hypothetical protein